MSQQKRLPGLVGFLLLIATVVPMILAGYIDIHQAETQQAEKSYKAAAQSYAHAAKLLFWKRGLWEQAGINAAKAGEYSTAIDYFAGMTDLSTEGWKWLCASHYQLGDFSAVTSSCLEPAKVKDSADLYRLVAYAYRGQKNWASERSALENLTRLDEQDDYAAFRLGLLLSLYAPDKAVAELTRASSLNPELDSAVQSLRAALAVSSTERDPAQRMIVMGRTYGLLQDWDLALTAFDWAIGFDEKNGEAWAWLGEAKQELGQDGSVELDKAVSLDHTSASIRALRALYWSRQNRYQQMLAEYLLAAEYEPDNPRWQVGVGDAYAKTGDLVSALAAYQHATDLAPQESDYWRLLAIFCAENDVRVEEIGLPAAKQAVQISPNDPQALDALGFSYLSSGRYANAEESLKQAIDLASNYFPAHLHLALTYLAQGNRTAAYNSLIFVRDSDTSGEYSEVAKKLLAKYFP